MVARRVTVQSVISSPCRLWAQSRRAGGVKIRGAWVRAFDQANAASNPRNSTTDRESNSFKSTFVAYFFSKWP